MNFYFNTFFNFEIEKQSLLSSVENNNY